MTALVIGDENRLFAEAVTALLQQQGYVVSAAVNNLHEIVSAVLAWRPEVCLVDQMFLDQEGQEALISMVSRSPEVKIVVIAPDDEPFRLGPDLEKHVLGHVHKSRGVSVLTESLRKVLDGQTVTDGVPGRPRASRRAASPESERLARRLTARERECLQLLVEGLNTQAMARRLGVATTTVRTHVQSTLNKLGTHSRLEAAAIAVREGLVEPPRETRRQSG